MATIKVRVLKPGPYLDDDMKQILADAGDVIEIRAGQYSSRVIELGCVVPDTAVPTPPTIVDGGLDAEQVNVSAADTISPPSTDVPDENPVDSLMEIDGIGQKTAQKIVDQGITSKASFVTADPVQLSEAIGTTVAKVQGWQATANTLLTSEE